MLPGLGHLPESLMPFFYMFKFTFPFNPALLIGYLRGHVCTNFSGRLMVFI